MYLLLAALAAFAVLVWVGRRSGRKADWGATRGLLGMAAFVGAAVAGVRGEWLLCAGLVAAGSVLALSVRGVVAARPSLDAARALLGVPPGASAEAIREAHRRLLWDSHPDRGGDPRRAAALNAARDRLLRS